ncbi:membrane protein [Nocardia thraciensis]
MLRSAPWSGNPLMRPADRVLAVARIVAVLLCLITVPVAGAIGTTTYTGYAERLRADEASKTPVVATVAGTTEEGARGGDSRVPVRWIYDGRTGAAAVPVTQTVAPGQEMTVWLDAGHTPTQPPAPPGTAAVGGIAAGFAIVVGTAVLCGFGCAALRFVVNRHSARQLDVEWRRFGVGHR